MSFGADPVLPGGDFCWKEKCEWWLSGFRYLEDGSKEERGRCAVPTLAEAMTGKVNR
jgi:hypothetical protein